MTALALPFGFQPMRSCLAAARVGFVLSCVGVSLVSLLSIPDLPSPSISQGSGIAMGKYGSKHARDGVIDSQGWRNHLKARHPQKTAHEVAALTGISADTVEKWFRGASPSLDTALVLFDVYGPEFLAAAFPKGLGWLAPSLRDREIGALRDAQAAIQARLDALA